MSDWTSYLALFAVGCVAGTINVIAGGGSFLTVPMLIFLGLPPTVANGTNRVGILLQNVGAVWGFNRYRLLEWRRALAIAVPGSESPMSSSPSERPRCAQAGMRGSREPRTRCPWV